MIKEVLQEMTTTDIFTIITAVLGILGLGWRFTTMINSLKIRSTEQDKKLTKLEVDLQNYKNTQETKLEKLGEKLGLSGDLIKDKLSLIERDLVQTSSFLKSNFEFLSNITKDNKNRIDIHDIKIHEIDKKLP